MHENSRQLFRRRNEEIQPQTHAAIGAVRLRPNRMPQSKKIKARLDSHSQGFARAPLFVAL
jgi:hypothetical protein